MDAQLSPALARWLSSQFGVDAISVRQLGLLAAEDPAIFAAAREAAAVVITEDRGFVDLVERLGNSRTAAQRRGSSHDLVGAAGYFRRYGPGRPAGARLTPFGRGRRLVA